MSSTAPISNDSLRSPGLLGLVLRNKETKKQLSGPQRFAQKFAGTHKRRAWCVLSTQGITFQTIHRNFYLFLFLFFYLNNINSLHLLQELELIEGAYVHRNLERKIKSLV